jgi:alkanesulfonate monooxygenase SsuD/methylene tetrahydromethanopterin reductase-like flavin-dependent oxidoreductase (luciferase family)
MKLGAYILPHGLDTFVASARVAEEAGWDRIWVVDGHMLYHDVYVYIAYGLGGTERVAFGTGVTNPMTRHYTVTASVAATLADLHPGRMILGIGRGDNAVRTLGRQPVPTTRLAAVVPKIRDLTRGAEVAVEGSEARIKWARTDVPIMMAATGPKNLRLAGSLADIVQIQVGVHPVAVRWAIDHVHEGARDAGRDPHGVEISLLCGLWVSDDLAAARQASRWAAPSAANHIEDVMRRNPEHGMPPELTRIVETRRSADADYDYYKDHGNAAAAEMDFLTDDLIDDFAIAGPASRCREKLAELEALGVGEVSGGFYNGEYDQLRAVGALSRAG